MKTTSQQSTALRRLALAAIAACTLGLADLAQADNHALIMTIDYKGVLPPGGGELPGIDQDGLLAKRIALGMGISDDHIVWMRNDQLRMDGMLGALRDLLARVKEGDKVLIYYSGHGFQGAGKGASKCSQALVAHDLAFYYDDQVRKLLDTLASKASQVVMLNDSCFSGGAVAAESKGIRSLGGDVAKYYPDAKASPANSSDYQCGQAVNKEISERTLGVFKRSQPARMLYIAASADNEVSYASPNGSYATLAWSQCLSSNAADRDGNGLIDGDELRQCSQDIISRTSRQRQTITLTGTSALPLSFVASNGGSGGATVANPGRTLESFRASADPTIRVGLSVAKSSLKIDQDLLDFSVNTDRDGYLTLLHVGTDGKFYVLFPNALDKNNYLKGGTHRFPRAAWGIKAQGPVGKSYIMAYLSDAPRDFSKELDTEGPFISGEPTEATVRKLAVVALTNRFGASPVVSINEVR